MPALTAREGDVVWDLTERHKRNDNQIYESWATKKVGYRRRMSSDVEDQKLVEPEENEWEGDSRC